MKNKISKINSLIKNNGHLVNFIALVVAISALIIAVIAFNTIATVYAIPKSSVDFCPSIIGAGGVCNDTDIRNTCGEKTEFSISCLEGDDSDYYQIISDIYNKGLALATNIEMEIQFENNTLVMTNSDMELSEGLISIEKNGVTRLSRIACQDNCLIQGIRIPVLKPSDSFELKITFDRRYFKQKPKFVKFILYQDGKKMDDGEKIININYYKNYEKQNYSNPRLPQPIDGIVSYRNIAANNATVFVKNRRTEEVMTTTTNELGQYSMDLSNMKSDTFYKDFISVTACFKNICSEKQIEADTILGANEANINIE